LQRSIEHANPGLTPVDRAEHLHVLKRVKIEPVGDAFHHQSHGFLDGSLRLALFDEEKVGAIGRPSVQRAVADVQSVLDDLAVARLTEQRGEFGHGDALGANEIAQDVAGTYRR